MGGGNLFPAWGHCNMLPFIRSDLASLTAYTPHPEGIEVDTAATEMDQLDTNECPYDWPEALKQDLVGYYLHQLESNRYPDGTHLSLKQGIAAYVNEAISSDGLIDTRHICVGNGSDELIRSVLIATCLGHQGSVLVANPTFSMYGILAQTLGIPVVTIGREDDFSMDLTAAQAALRSSSHLPVRVIFAVHPNSPTGNSLTPKEQDWLKTLPPEILVVVDEAYFEFSQHTLVQEVLRRPNWIILRTFSKAFRLAAHRVGYGIANPELTATLEKVRLPYNLPSFSQAAAKLALIHRQELLQVVPEILAERQRLSKALERIKTLRLWPSDGNFLFLTAATATATLELRQTLKQQGTSVRHTGGGLRITIGSPEENQNTLSRIQSHLELLV